MNDERNKEISTRVAVDRYERIKQYSDENGLSQDDALRELIHMGIRHSEREDIREDLDAVLEKLEKDDDEGNDEYVTEADTDEDERDAGATPSGHGKGSSLPIQIILLLMLFGLLVVAPILFMGGL